MLIKLDMKNAFDKVKLPFLFRVLLSFGFIPEFVNLIKACRERPWIAPLVNGKPTEFFQASRGLRQGCPLSPFLYILMVETLNKQIIVEKEVGYIPGIKISQGINPINHSLFADDSLLLGGASLKIALAFKDILQTYCIISSTLINEKKVMFMDGM